MTKYEVIALKDAQARGLEGSSAGCNPDNTFALVYRVSSDGTHEFIGADGGEPEDQLLGRDWDWVVSALNDTYALGRREALESVRAELGQLDELWRSTEPTHMLRVSDVRGALDKLELEQSK